MHSNRALCPTPEVFLRKSHRKAAERQACAAIIRLQPDERLLVVHVLCIVACLVNQSQPCNWPQPGAALGARPTGLNSTFLFKNLPSTPPSLDTLTPTPAQTYQANLPFQCPSLVIAAEEPANPPFKSHARDSAEPPHLPVGTAAATPPHHSRLRELRYMYSRQLHAFRVEPPPKLQKFRCTRIPSSSIHCTNG